MTIVSWVQFCLVIPTVSMKEYSSVGAHGQGSLNCFQSVPDKAKSSNISSLYTVQNLLSVLHLPPDSLELKKFKESGEKLLGTLTAAGDSCQNTIAVEGNLSTLVGDGEILFC